MRYLFIYAHFVSIHSVIPIPEETVEEDSEIILVWDFDVHIRYYRPTLVLEVVNFLWDLQFPLTRKVDRVG